MCRKMDGAILKVDRICEMLEKRSGHYYGCSWFSMYKALLQLALSNIGLPSIDSVNKMLDYAEEHHPHVKLSDILDYVAMILVGEIEMTDENPETEAAADTMSWFVCHYTGWTLEEVIETIKRGIA